MKKPQRKTRAHNIFTTPRVLAYSARTCSLPYLVALALSGSAAQRHKTVRGRVGETLVHLYKPLFYCLVGSYLMINIGGF